MPSPWVKKATGTPGLMVADAAEVRRALKVFSDPTKGCELIALTTGVSKTRVGDDYDALLLAAESMPSGIGIYFRINPVPPALTRAANDKDILSRRWLYIDADPVKPGDHKDDPASDEEKERTREVMEAVNEYLSGLGWSAPVITDSGNGFGLFFRIDLPNDEYSRALVKRVLYELSAKFSGPNGVIDKSTHNAGRLAKLPGTWAKKGAEFPGRPYRQARLLYVPDEVVPVDIEAILAVAGTEAEKPVPPSESNGKPSGDPYKKRATSGGDAAYGKAALDRECARVYLSRPPSAGGDGRNNALNRAAFALGQLVAGGVLSEAEVIDRLFDAACRCGLDKDTGGDRAIRDCIQRAMRDGGEEPRKAPERPSPRDNPSEKKREEANREAKQGPTTGPTTDEPLTVSFAKIRPQIVEWLVRNRIPKRFITVFAGRTGVGKSFVACDLIARLSTGGEIPFAGGECFTPGGTLILSEDSHEYVLAPRLMNAGADLSRVHAMTWAAMAKYNLGDTDMLAKAVKEVPGGVSLVLIDPPTNFLDAVDEHKNSEVRQLVMRVVEWVLGQDLACLFVLHVNKQSGKGVEALNRVMGSVAWVTTARIAHTLCDDPDTADQCLWVPLKNNLGPLVKAIAYRIAGESETGAKIEWIGEVDTTANEAMGHGAPRERRDVTAAKWLVARFREKLEWRSDDLFAAAKEANVSRNAVFEAKTKLKLPAARKRVVENGETVYVWWVPEDWPGFDEPTEPAPS